MKKQVVKDIKKDVKKVMIGLGVLLLLFVGVVSCTISLADVEPSEEQKQKDLDQAYSACLQDCGNYDDGQFICDAFKGDNNEDGLWSFAAYCECTNKNNLAYCNNKFGFGG